MLNNEKVHPPLNLKKQKPKRHQMSAEFHCTKSTTIHVPTNCNCCHHQRSTPPKPRTSTTEIETPLSRLITRNVPRNVLTSVLRIVPREHSETRRNTQKHGCGQKAMTNTTVVLLAQLSLRHENTYVPLAPWLLRDSKDCHVLLILLAFPWGDE